MSRNNCLTKTLTTRDEQKNAHKIQTKKTEHIHKSPNIQDDDNIN